MAQVKKANRPQFLFYCGNLDKETFAVVSFTGRDAISQPYKFTINLISSKADIKADDVVNKQATLFMLRNDEYYPYSGVVLDFDYVETTVDHSVYVVTLVPKMALLNFSVQTRIFQKMKVNDIIKKVLDDAKLSDYYEIDIRGTFPDREYVLQYQESDMNFISRLMEDAGIWYFFKENPLLPEEADSPGKEKLVISNKPGSFAHIGGESEIQYRSISSLYSMAEDQEKEFVNRISYKKRIITKNVQVKNYNYRTPEVNLSAKKQIPAGHTGTVYKYGDEFKDADGAQKYAELHANRIGSQQADAIGKSTCRGLRAGMRFAVTEHDVRQECNDTYLVRSVIHSGSHSSAGGVSGVSSYVNDFIGTPSSLIEAFAPPLSAKAPRINGVMTAAIETNGSDYASLDDSGRYKVRMPFDLSGSKNYDASKYMRLAQPYSGANYGMHFPSHEGTEMIFACIDGNPDRPIGLGTIPNANTKSPVVGGNKAQNVIRTAGKNEIILDDTKDKQKITLTTAAKNSAQFDDENKKIVITTTGDKNGGNQILLDDKNKSIVFTAMKHGITMSYGDNGKCITIQTEKKHVIKIDDEKKIITIQTAGGHGIALDDDGKKITLKDGQGKNTVTLDGNGGLILDSKGKIEIKAQQDLILSAANIKMTANNGIEAKATADLKLKGMNLEAKADMNVKIEGGMKLEMKGGMQTKLGGMMTEVGADTMMKVKGAIVMIN